MDKAKIGNWAFILGVILAILGGALGGYLSAYAPWITLLLVILGLIVGFLNISQKETMEFLIAAIALVVVGTAAQLSTIDSVVPLLGSMIQAMVANVAVFVTPAALVVSLKAVYSLSKSVE